MTDGTSSREARIMAALAGELDEAELRRFDADYASDPALRADTDDAREMLERIGRAELSWSERELPEGLAERVERATSEGRLPLGTSSPAAGVASGTGPTPSSDTSSPVPDTARQPSELAQARERRGLRRFSAGALGAAAASALIVGGLAGAGISRLADAPPGGPPGTLGAVESVAFGDVRDGTTVTASLVAHTWGTETLLEVDGLRVGETFEVVLTSTDGEELVSGTFLGSERTVTCSMNAAVLRDDVSEVEIRDQQGAVVASAFVPDV